VLDRRQKRIKELFQAAAQCAPEERSAYLGEQCGGDAALRSAVESLLAAGEDAGGFLEGPPLLSAESLGSQGAGGAQVSDPIGTKLTFPSTTPAQVIDRYRLLEKVGEGGMGEVWLAEQQEPVRRRVALKVIKAGMDTAQVIARFEVERQALALMDHPAIARVFDAGATSAGRPYFVMEHVAGLPITRHCDQQRLGIAARLELFVQVCEGVQHAHQKAVLHRDLKPSNVLVASHDGRATPKIIDFGVAKAMAQPLTGRTLHTGLGMLIGTPGYMSPEQADLVSQDVDTRTDVYSLGVMLYELLVGVLPFDPQRLRKAGWEGLGRLLREQEPATPSKRLTSLPAAASAESSNHRQAEVSALRRQLSGDLDWITMKTIEPDRERRYGSPAELAEEIRRHLRDEPVQARPPNVTYRMGKFVRRHRLGVAVASVLTLALGAGLIGTTSGLIRARRAETEARREAATSERVSGFLSDLLASVDPERMGKTLVTDLRQRVGKAEAARGGDEAQVATRLASFDDDVRGVNRVDAARQLMDREILAPAAQAIEKELSGDPILAARLHATIGETYEEIGLHSAAESFGLKALEARRRLLGAEHPDTLRSMSNVGRTYESQGRYTDAEKILKEAREIQRRVVGPEHPDTLESTARLALVIHRQGRYREAGALNQDTLDIRRRVLGEDHPDTLSSMHYLAASLSYQQRDAEAEALYREALDRLRRVLGPENAETLLTMNDLANFHFTRGRNREAEALYLEALEIRRRVFGEDHHWTLVAMGNLGGFRDYQGRHAEAETLYRQALAGLQRTEGGEHPHSLVFTYSLGDLYREQRRYTEAERLLKEAADGSRRLLGEQHPQTLEILGRLGLIYRGQGRTAEAARQLEDAVGGLRRALGEAHPRTLVAMADLAGFYLEQRRYDEAERLYGDLLDRQREAFVEGDSRTLDTQRSLARLHFAAGRREKARTYFQSLLAAGRREAERSDADARAKSSYARDLLTCEPAELRDPEEALRFALEAAAASEHQDSGVLATLALAYSMTARPDDAVETQRQALGLLPEDQSPLRAELKEDLARYQAAARRQ